MAFFVNGELVSDGVIEAEMNGIRQPLYQAMAGEDPATIEKRLRDWAGENLIERLLLRQAALDGGPVLDEGETRLRIESLLERITAGVPPPDEREIAAYHKQNPQFFRTDEVLHASHIVKHVHHPEQEEAALREIRKAEAELRGGGAFAELADRYSDCPGSGGDLGQFRRGEMVDEFEAALAALQPGDVSGVFRTPFGFHIATLHARQGGLQLPLEAVRDAIRTTLHGQAKERAVEQYIDRLRDAAEIRPAVMSASQTAGAGQ